ncbi:MAG: T9SS type A sorting domain-containing protein, partial [Bacteroidales bacterium]|nr:T9SS type A sorting domain-containing protein [Bacteroidales bacterium]
NTFVGLCSWLDVRNGLAFLNHPARSSRGFSKFTEPPNDKIAGMELFNKADDFSRYYYNDGFYPDDGNLSHFDEANSRGWKIGASGADDNHGATWGTRTDYRMAILSKHLSREELFAAMQARRFYSTLDKNLALSFKMGGEEMGSTLVGETYDIQIQANDMDEESFTKVMLFRNGFEFETWDIDTSDVDISFPIITFNGEFFYIKVTQADGDEAISSPIYIKGGLFNTRPTCSISTPLNGTHFDNPQTINITAEASDTDGSIASVEFFVNGNSIGSDDLAPFSLNYIIPENGSYEFTAKATDDDGLWVTSTAVAFTVGVFSSTVSSRIAEEMDDIEERSNGNMNPSSSDIELVYDVSNQIIGLRFTGLNIPPGAAIESANIQFTVDEVSTGTCVLSIKGHNIDNSPQFTSANYNVSDRHTTVAEISWIPTNWPSVGASGADQKTPDLSSIIQEIVNRAGYMQSSAISIIITGTGVRTTEAYEDSPGSAALLTVEYTFGMESQTGNQSLDLTPIRIYPNPVSDGKLTIEIDGGTLVTVFDISGRICHQSKIENSKTVIDVSGLKSGLYIINISNDNKVVSQKLVVK